MNRSQRQSGFSLVEAMISLLILSVGMLGLANMTILAGHSTHVGRKYSQAIAIAHDLMQQVELWDYDDARLENRNSSNDTQMRPPRLIPLLNDVPQTLTSVQQADFIDAAVDDNTVAAASSLLEGGDFAGIKKSLLPPGFQRLWSVRESPDFDSNGHNDFKVVALTVRWQDEVRREIWRSATFFTAKYNPADLSL